MFGIGLPELLLIMGLGLVVLGPDKLPDLAKQLAKGMVELKRTANSLKASLQEELEEENGGSPLLDDLRENAGQPWRGLDGKGGVPSDKLPEGFDEYGVINTESPGNDFVGVNDPADAPGPAEAAVETGAEEGSDEQVAAKESVSELAPAPDSETVAAETPNQQDKPAA